MLLATFVWVYMESRFVRRYGMKKRKYIAYKSLATMASGITMFIVLHYVWREWL